MELALKLRQLNQRLDNLERTARQTLSEGDSGQSVISAASVAMNIQHGTTSTTGLFASGYSGSGTQLEDFGGDPVAALSVDFTMGETGTVYVLASAEIEQRGLPNGVQTYGTASISYSGTNPDGSSMSFIPVYNSDNLENTSVKPYIQLGIYTGTNATSTDHVSASLSDTGIIRVSDADASRGGTCTVTMTYGRTPATVEYAFGRRSLTVIPL